AGELEHILNDSGAKILFMPGLWRKRDYREMAAPLKRATALQHVVIIDDEPGNDAISWQQFRARATGSYPPGEARADDLAALIYTSGTTSKPKGVMHTHNSLLAEARSAAATFWREQL